MPPPPVPTALSLFDAAREREESEEEARRARNNLIVQSGIDPEMAAAAQRDPMGGILGPGYDPRRLERQRRDELLVSTSPRLQRWMADPANAAIAYDDVHPLSFWERLSDISDTVFHGSTMDTRTERDIARTPLGRRWVQGQRNVEMARLGNRANPYAMQGTLSVDIGGSPLSVAEWAQLQRLERTPRAEGGGILGTVTEQLPQIFGAFDAAGRRAIRDASRSWRESMGYLDGATPLGAIETVANAPFAALTAGAIGLPRGAVGFTYEQEAGAAFLEFRQMVDRQGNRLDQRLAGEAASQVGQINAVLEFAGLSTSLKAVGAGQLLSRLTRGGVRQALRRIGYREALRRVATGTAGAALSEGVTELSQEGVTIMLGQMAQAAQGGEWEALSDEELAERLWESFSVGATVGGVLGGVGASGRFLSDIDDVRRARDQQALFEAIADGAQSSALRTRAPARFASAVDALVAGGPLEQVTIDPDRFVGYFEDRGEDAFAVADQLSGVGREALEQALESGAPLAIPTGTYAAQIAATPHHAELAQHVRMGSGALTPAEVAARLEFGVDLERATSEAARLQAEAREVVRETESVRSRLMEMFTVAEGYTDAANEAFATYYAESIITLAERAGMKSSELLDAINLEMQGPFEALRAEEGAVQGAEFEQRGRIIDAHTARGERREVYVNPTQADLLRLTRPPSGEPSYKHDTVRAIRAADGTVFVARAYDLTHDEIAAAAAKAGTPIADYLPHMLPGDAHGVETYTLQRRGNELFRAAALYQRDEQVAPFYSAVERVIAESTTARASGAQWWSTISRAPGVKREELQWIGLEDFLKAREGPIPREEVLQFVRENGVRVEETVLGDKNKRDLLPPEVQRHRLELIEEKDRLLREHDEIRSPMTYRADNPRVDEIQARAKEIDDELYRIAVQEQEASNAAEGLATRWSQYTLPGGENYRELLLRLPPNDMAPSAAEIAEAKRIAEQNGDDWEPLGPNGRQRYHDLAARKIDTNFRSSHFDAPNILAHVRFNERTDANGARTLFIEEVQSDWHQGGRERGYRETARPEDMARIEAAARASGVPALNTADDLLKAYRQGHISNIQDGELRAAMDRVIDGQDQRRVPDAPFKNNAWASLALKRMIRWAAENGFDQIAWTRGQHQIERFNLATQARSIRLVRRANGAEVLEAPLVGNLRETKIVDITPEQPLEAIIGKELADRVRAAPENDFGGGAATVREIKGDDLRFGGEGMRAFYDRILPNIANDLGKKFGARVGETEIRIPPDGGALSMRRTVPAHNETVHSLPITPEMREMALEGQALFQPPKRGGPAGVIYMPHLVEGGDLRQATIKLFEGRDLSTPLHEGGHLFLEVLQMLAKREPSLRSRFRQAGDNVPINVVPDGVVTGIAKPKADAAEVTAALAEQHEVVTTSWGAELSARTGKDYILTDQKGDRWVVRRDIFDATYVPAAKEGQFRKNPDLEVGYWISPDTRTIETLEGPVEAAPGDYVMVGAVGEMWPMKPVRFAQRNEVVESRDPAVPTQLQRDWATVLDWFGVTQEQWAGFNVEQKRKYHEQWARGNEAYLMEGKAPSAALRDVFAMFKRWLTFIYKSVQALNVNLTPAIREVMDRMVASDEAIEAARAEQAAPGAGGANTMSREQFGGTDKQYARYVRNIERAREDALADLEKEALGALVADRTRWWRSEEGKTRRAVEIDLDSEPARRAYDWLATGRWRHAANPPDGLEPMRISPALVVENYGQATLDALPPEIAAADSELLVEQAKEARAILRRKEPLRFASWVQQQGGVRDPSGDVKAILGSATVRPGLINNATGLDPDEMALRAWEAGYFGVGPGRLLQSGVSDAETGEVSFSDPRLTDNENKAVEMRLNGMSNADAADEMQVAEGTYIDYLASARRKGVDVPRAQSGPARTVRNDVLRLTQAHPRETSEQIAVRLRAMGHERTTAKSVRAAWSLLQAEGVLAPAAERAALFQGDNAPDGGQAGAGSYRIDNLGQLSYERPAGPPRVLYHGTGADVDSFAPGSHFGTQSAANRRLADNAPENARVYVVEAPAGDYVRVTDAGDAWGSGEYWTEMARNRSPRSDAEVDLFRALRNDTELRSLRGEALYARLDQHFRDHDFAGAIYANQFEGGESVFIPRGIPNEPPRSAPDASPIHPGFAFFSGERPTVREFLDKLDGDLKNTPAYTMDDEALVAARAEAQAIADWFAARGVNINAKDTTLREQIKGIVAREDAQGVDPDLAASIFGFASGEELLTALSTLKPRREAIEEETRRRMLRAYGDPFADGQIMDEARLAVHREARARVIELELDAIERAIGGGSRPVSRAARDIAEAQIERMAVKQVRKFDWFLGNERRHAKQAMKALEDGDLYAARTAKHRQLVNFHRYALARKAAKELDAAQRYFRKFERNGVRESIDADYLDQIDGLLEQYEFRRISQKAERRRIALSAWATQMEQRGLGHMVAIDPRILEEARRRPYSQLTLDEVRALHDAVKNIEHLGRLKDKLLDAADRRAFRETVTDLAEQMQATGPISPAVRRNYSPTAIERAQDRMREAHAEMTRMEFLFRYLDGGQANGPLWRALWLPFAQAANKEAGMMNAATRSMEAIWARYTNRERTHMFKRRIAMPDLPVGAATHYTKAELLSIALNLGNEGNLRALVDGFGWGTARQGVDALTDEQYAAAKAQIMSALSRVLDTRDWQTVQSIWDLTATFRDEAFALQKDLTGLDTEAVESTPLTLADGTVIAGGYYPLKFDAARDRQVNKEEQRQSVQELFGSNWSRPMTRKGHLIARVGSGGRPVKLSLTVFSEHVQNVVHDISYRRAVIDADKIIGDAQFADAFVAVAGQPMYDQLRPWLQAIASDRVDPTAFMWKFLQKLRGNVAIAAMGYRISTGLQQITGLLQAVPHLGAAEMAVALTKLVRNPATIAQKARVIANKSEFMRNRMQTLDRDIRETLERMETTDKLYPIRHNAFALVGMFDWAVSATVWTAAYDKAMTGNIAGIAAGDEQAAIYYGDQAVRTTQSAGLAQDLPAIMRGNQVNKLLTMFFSYFSVLYNWTAYDQIMGVRKGRVPPHVFIANMALIYIISPLIAEALAGRWEPRDDEDEEDRNARLASVVARFPFQTVPVLRDIANAIGTGYEYQLSPAGSAPGKIAEALRDLSAGRTFESEATTKRAVTALGYAFGLPTPQAWVTVDYVADKLEGEEEGFDPIEAFVADRR